MQIMRFVRVLFCKNVFFCVVPRDIGVATHNRCIIFHKKHGLITHWIKCV